MNLSEFAERFAAVVRGGSVRPVFRPDGVRFCFTDGDSVVWDVDPAAGTMKQLFDAERLQYTVGTFEFVADTTIRFEARDGTVLDLDLTSYQVRRLSPAEALRRRLAVPRNVRKGLIASDPGPDEVPSPDGRHLLTEQATNLALRGLLDDRVTPLTATGEPGFAWEIEGAAWSPDSERIVANRVDRRHVSTRLPIVHWLGPNEDAHWIPVTRAGGALHTYHPAVIDVRSGRIVPIDLPGEPDQTITPHGFTLDSSAVYLTATDRRQRYLRLYLADATTGSARLVCEETQDTFIVGDQEDFVRFGPEHLVGEDRVLFFSERDGWRHLYLYGLDGKEIGQVTSGAFEVVRILGVAADTVFFTAHSDPDRPYDVHLCRTGLDGNGFRQLTTQPGRHEPVPTCDLKYFIDTHSSVHRPPSVDLVTAEGAVTMTLATADVTGLDELVPEPPEPFTVTAADGVTALQGVLYRPPGFDPARKYPVIEYIYGGPQEVIHQVGFGDPIGVLAMGMAAHGFVVYSVDGRGTPQRGKAFQDVGYGRFQDFHVQDHAHVLRRLLDRHPFMDADRIGVTGGSYGGYNTVRTMLFAPDLYHVGVAVCPAYSLEDVHAQAIEPYMGLPVDHPEAYAAARSYDEVDRLAGKLLMIHGTADVNAPFSATMKMCDALVRADKPYDLVVIPEADHHFDNVGAHHLRYCHSATMRYFGTHLMGVACRQPRTRS
ncbi:S9 family peptidase [Actinocrispum wychmicini]|uniref:Dipeptidyl aminopeptidase/acylaminoacyl peptidase n=1 Tax=Actinocrispum wychmicini TaxID=1213861 RepID=A0A4R2JBN8_9PSEU|nr:prolyl oligopeptidase family serine peptidase [Actinocrispum wychmicini]TCO54176.1 dipeptidyl aminopeptidase/acylaminoacyl peptidase [Actinocrispum wychmicini]